MIVCLKYISKSQYSVLFTCLSNGVTLKEIETGKLFTKISRINFGLFSWLLDLLVLQAQNNTYGLKSWYSLVLTQWIFMSWGCSSSSDFTHTKIQTTQADRIIPFTFNGLEMNGVKYALFYSLIASLGWGNWVLFPPLTEWIMTSSDPRQGLENLD